MARPMFVNSGLSYPPSVRSAEERLRFYAERFNTVEVDSTYYALPAERNAKLWAERTAEGFLFNIKPFDVPDVLERVSSASQGRQARHGRLPVSAIFHREARQFRLHREPSWAAARLCDRDRVLPSKLGPRWSSATAGRLSGTGTPKIVKHACPQ